MDLIERLHAEVRLRRLCGFDLRNKIKLHEGLFSRAFAEFAALKLPGRVHEALIKTQLGDALIGHVPRDATVIAARERPIKVEPAPEPPRPRKE